jgi:hypothetical protein
MSFRTSSALSLLASVSVLLAWGCSGSDGGGSGKGGAPAGGTIGSGGHTARGGTAATGGATSVGGIVGTGGAVRTGGATSTATPSSGGVASSGGNLGTGGAGTGGAARTGGVQGRDASAATDGAPDTGRDPSDGGRSICDIPMPTEGGKTYTGSRVDVTIDGYNYGIWTNGGGGTITIFPAVHAFSASWSDSKNFLAHAGLDYQSPKKHTDLGTIVAEFSENKTGNGGNFSMIGMYGWTQNPCVEWYIVEDSWNGLSAKGSATVTIDGSTYYLSTSTTTGTGGANACGPGYSGPWTQMISTRKGARKCGVITVSDHFAAWEAQGWKLGGVTSIHVNAEVGGGKGTIEFPVANITTTGK